MDRSAHLLLIQMLSSPATSVGEGLNLLMQYLNSPLALMFIIFLLYMIQVFKTTKNDTINMLRKMFVTVNVTMSCIVWEFPCNITCSTQSLQCFYSAWNCSFSAVCAMPRYIVITGAGTDTSARLYAGKAGDGYTIPSHARTEQWCTDIRLSQENSAGDRKVAWHTTK